MGGDRVISLKELANLLVEVNGGGEYEQRPFPVDRKRIDIGDYYADDRRIRTTLGWQPRTPLAEGLATTLAFYRKHIAQYI